MYITQKSRIFAGIPKSKKHKLHPIFHVKLTHRYMKQSSIINSNARTLTPKYKSNGKIATIITAKKRIHKITTPQAPQLQHKITTQNCA